MTVSVYTRHSGDCKHSDDINYRQCNCRKWIQYNINGKQTQKSAKTRSYEQAQKLAATIQKKLEQAQLGEAPKVQEAVTVAQAVAAYLADKRAQKLTDVTLTKLHTIFEKPEVNGSTSLAAFCHQHGILFLSQIDLNVLREWRNTWNDGALAAKKKQERVRGFFHFCHNSGWVSTNPAIGLSRIKVEQTPTDYFTREEFNQIIDATYLYDSKTVDKMEMQNNATRLRTLALLMRSSGLAIRDAVTLERDRLDNNNRLFLYRAKTGLPVYTVLPPFVADALRSIPPGPKPNPRYFFWSGNGSPKSVVADWQRAFRKLFKIANIRHQDGTPKRCFPHMFRDTFAVEALLAGVPLDQVALLCGHSSTKTTEKHYAPFVRARQEQLENSIKLTWNGFEPKPQRKRKAAPISYQKAKKS